MKKLIFTTAVLIMSMVGSSAFAWTNVSGDVIVDNNPQWDNWFVSAGVGTTMYAGESDRHGAFGKRLAPAVELSLGKWVSPYLGGRLQYSGFNLKGHTYSQNNLFVTGDANDGIYQQKWGYMHLRFDLMLNVTNFIAGYDENRFYSLVPYAGAGWARTPKTNNDAITATLGLYNSFRINSNLDLYVDLHGSVFGEDAFDAEEGGDYGVDGILTTTVGITLRFGKQGWRRPVSQYAINEYKSTIRSNEEEIEKYKEQLENANQENEALRSQLEAAKEPVIDVKIPSTVLLFEFNSSKLSRLSKVNLTKLATVILKDGSNDKFVIMGYADNVTGSAMANDRLSRRRANAVYDFLTEECGVPSSKLVVRSKGGVDNMFYDDADLSRVVIID